MDEYQVLEEAKKEKATKNPKVRYKDPDCWKCLSDEQRDVINEWYFGRLIEERKKSKSNKDNSKKKKTEEIIDIFIFALPISWILACYDGAWDEFLAGEYLYFFWHLICACVISVAVIGLGMVISETSKSSLIGKVIYLFVLLIVMILITSIIL